jgi:uncharacterized repeat protein (TIGR01451 family)
MRFLAIDSPAVRILMAIGLSAVLMVSFSQTPGRDPVSAHPSPPFTDGAIPDSAACDDFFIELLGFIDIDIPDPGWVWVQNGNPGFPRFVSATGEVTKSKVTHTDYPDVHDSHDHNIDIFLDPGQESLLSEVNGDHDGDGLPDSLEVEWETGILTDEFSGDGSAHFFPKWAWPNEGDRVWTNGHWIFDCGHPEDLAGAPHAKTEIHPARAVASMRQQFHTLPGSGVTPVQVTATDLYIHGRSGVVTDILECGQDVVLGSGSCTTPFGSHDPVADHIGTPIDDNYEFDICLPPLPFDKAAPMYLVENGPGNTLAPEPELEFVDAVGPCAFDGGGPLQLHARIPLEGSGATPDDVYARKIYTGWIFPAEDLKHLKLTLTRMHLHDDDDVDPGDCECTFFWMNVDRAPNEWIRLSDHATGNMNDFDDDGGLGDGNMGMDGAVFDFFVGNGVPYAVRANGYDGGVGDGLFDFQLPTTDCFDEHFGHHDFGSHVEFTILPPGLPDICYSLIAIDATIPDNDPYPALGKAFGPAESYGLGGNTVEASESGEYNLQFTVEELPLTEAENGADLVLTKDCKPDGSVRAGVEFLCTILVENPTGPGLPHDVIVHDTLLTDVDSADYVLEPPTFTFSGVTNLTDPCITDDNPIETIPGGVEFFCNIGTVPIGGKAIITMRITSDEGGDFNNYANVFSASADADMTNNRDDDSVHVTPVADLSITKSDSEDPLVSGTSLTYTLLVHNSGPSTAVNVRAEDLLPAGVSINSVSGTGGAACVFGVPGDDSRPTVCTFGSIPSGGSRTMTVVVTVLPGIHNSLHNDARVSSDVLDLNNANDVDSEDTLIRVTDLEIVKTADGNTYKASGTVIYTIEVTNHGPSDAHGVVVTDNLPLEKRDRVVFFSPIICTKPAGSTLLTCNLGSIAAGQSASVTVVVVYKGNRGLINNTADVTSTTTDPVPGNNSSTASVLIGTPPKP